MRGSLANARYWCAAVALAVVAAAMPALGLSNRPAQSIRPAGVTVNLAQTVAWIDTDLFAVGRWDGTISLFQVLPSGGSPVIRQAMAAPSGAGIEMLASADPATLVTSDGRTRLAVWRRSAGAGPFALASSPAYDAAFGPANSGTPVAIDGKPYFVSGHESGDILLWAWTPGRELTLARSSSVRSPEAPSNPWQIRNVRGLKPWRTGHVVTASEDGDLVGLRLPDLTEVFRFRYNPKAQRGINNISIVGDRLLLANCAVGSEDRNLWLFDLSSGSPVLQDAENLVLDLLRSQIFDFDAVLTSRASGRLGFFASTEEGLLWEGDVDGDQLVITGVTRIASEGGAVLAVAPRNDFIAVASNAIRLFRPE